MINYETIKNNPTQFLAMTSMKTKEFEYLLCNFEPHWENYHRYFTLMGKRRKRPVFDEYSNDSLPGAANKLFFLVLYLKIYTLQQCHSALFGISQGKTSRMVKILQPLLDKTLYDIGCMPSSNPEDIQHMLEQSQAKAITVDATERSIPRATDYSVQEEYYSGKKKDHTVKNNILATDWQEIVYLSPSHEGKKHDKKICDEEEYQFPENITLRKDSGYQGYNPPGVRVEQPVKSSKNNPLTKEQKEHNKIISAKRVVVEHTIMGCKRLRIVKERLRKFCWETIDGTMRIAAALHNFRVRSPIRAYACTPAHVKFKFYS